MRLSIRSALFAAAALLASAVPSFSQKPAVEMSSLLKSFKVYPDGPAPDAGGTFWLDRFYCAFLPPECIYDGRDLIKDVNQTWAVLRRAGNSTELGRWPLLAEKAPTVFSSLRVVGGGIEFNFERPGDYVLSIQIDDDPFGQLPFEVSFVESDDPFNPARKTYVTDGPYKTLSMLTLPDTGAPGEVPFVRVWTRGGIYNKSGDNESLALTIEQNGLLVYTTNETVLRAIDHDSTWRAQDFSLKFPKGQGGGPVKTANLLSNDGTYEVIVRRQGEVERVWRFDVAGGKVVPIPRQELGYQPHFDYLMGRWPGSDSLKQSDLYWMEALGAEDAVAAASSGPAAVAGPTDADRAGWVVKSSQAPASGFELTVTSVATRMDSGIAVGPDIIAFGTGSNTGVSWLKVGEESERTIPGGQEASASLFAVCGSKIVLTKRNQVLVYDTTTESMTTIPEEDIYLWRTSGGQYAANFFRADGHLVATLNNPTKVSDRAQVKVIDVSGPEPRIIALHGPDFPPGDINSVAVDAKSGRVAFGSQKQQGIFHAPVAPGAPFTKVDLAAYDSFGRSCQLVLDGSRALYFDAAGAQKLRLVDLDKNQIGVGGQLLNERRYYDIRDGVLGFASDQSRGSGAAVAVGRFGEQLAFPPGTGEDDFGLGQSVAVSEKGLVFVAGDGKGGVGSGEVLYVTDGTAWRPVAGPDGAAIPAVDVVAGPSVIAFKTGKANNTRVAYAVVGTGAALGQIQQP